MKILLSAYACEPYRGSEPGNGWNWALHLARAGHQVQVLTRPDGRAAIELALAVDPQPGLAFYYVDTPASVRGQAGVFGHYFSWQRAAYQAVRGTKLDVDLIHHVTWGSIHGGSLLWKTGFPFVFGPAGGGQTFPLQFRQYLGMAWGWEALRNLFTSLLPYTPATRSLVRNSRLVLATNADTLALVRRAGAQRSEYFLDSGLAEEFFPQAVPKRPGQRPLKILWVARLMPRKAPRLALDAVRRLKIPYRLTILGGGALEGNLRRWIQEYKLEDKVDARGQVDWSQVREVYQEQDVFLLTSLRDSSPNQLLEAMAFGLPVVTLDHQGTRDMVPKRAGIKVPVSTVEETVEGLAAALERLGNDPDLRQEMGRVGYVFAKTHAWPEKTKRIERYYAEIQG